MVSTFNKHYWNEKCNAKPELKADNVTSLLKSDDLDSMDCNPGKLTSVIFEQFDNLVFFLFLVAESFLALILMLGTLWLGVKLRLIFKISI